MHAVSMLKEMEREDEGFFPLSSSPIGVFFSTEHDILGSLCIMPELTLSTQELYKEAPPGQGLDLPLLSNVYCKLFSSRSLSPADVFI